MGRGAGRSARRAITLLAVRLLRFSRATMAVAGAGWEIEARRMARQVIEVHARLHQVGGDRTDEMALQWLEGKPPTGIGAAIRAAAPDLDADAARSCSERSRRTRTPTLARSCAPSRQWTKTSRRRSPGGRGRTGDTRLTLLVCATFTAEAATAVAGEAGVEHPNRDESVSYLGRVGDAVAPSLGGASA